MAQAYRYPGQKPTAGRVLIWLQHWTGWYWDSMLSIDLQDGDIWTDLPGQPDGWVNPDPKTPAAYAVEFFGEVMESLDDEEPK